MLSKIWRFSLE